MSGVLSQLDIPTVDLEGLVESMLNGFAKATVGDKVLYDYSTYFPLYQKIALYCHNNRDEVLEEEGYDTDITWGEIIRKEIFNELYRRRDANRKNLISLLSKMDNLDKQGRLIKHL